MLGIYGLLGIIAGLVALLFVTLVHWTGQVTLAAAAGIDPTAHGLATVEAGFSLPAGERWWLLLIPTVGFLISGVLSTYLAPETMGTGTGAIIDTYHRRGGVIRRRVPFVKMLASAATIGSGGSAGVEGPVGFIAGGIGSTLGRLFKLSTSERRILVMAGFAAGIGAVFHAPMAASMFAAEVLYKEIDIEHEVLVPSIIASTLAYAVFGAVQGWEPIWVVPPVRFESIVELLPYLILAIVCATAGRFFIFLEHGLHRVFGNLPVPRWAPVMLGGLLVGAIGLFFPQVIGVGYGLAQLSINGHTAAGVLVILAIAKMFTSALTAGSGGSGGLFAPSLVIGGVLGGAVAAATNAIAPGLDVDPAAFAIVGMAGFFAAVINAPLSTVIMVSELVGNYRLLVPTLWVCIIAWFAARKWNLYLEQSANRMTAPGHVADMMTAVLHRIRVADAMEPGKPTPVTVSPNTKLHDLVQHFAMTVQGVFPIVDPHHGGLVGVVDGWALRRTVGESGMDEMLVAADFLAPALTARPDDSLDLVVERMSRAGYDEVVVVADDVKATLVGILSRREIVSAYHREMLATAPHPEGEAPAVAPPAVALELIPGAVNLPDALARGGVVHALRGTTRSEVLADLVERATLPPEVDRALLLEQLKQREELGSTYVGDGVAFPHPSSADSVGTATPLLCIATPRKPVPWGSEAEGENAPRAEIIVLLLAPQGSGHLALLRGVARAMRDAGLRRDIKKHAPLRHLAARLDELSPATRPAVTPGDPAER
ncbi:MAG: chloride channel protein [Deltaproteobacteria bacterium HGW-Deltaproteobacteria-14]|nr:MAG: chloride channel protein [Deltaproteobacteria bacterium HGW-Deltaproteobacteria-14]